MIPNDQPARKDMIERMLKSLEDYPPDGLTKWEEDYLVSITDQFKMGRNLSDKQCEILERIYDK